MPSTLVLVIKHWVGSIDSVPTFSKTGGLTKCWGNLKNAVNVSVFAVLIQWISVRKKAEKILTKFKIYIFWNLHIHNLKSNSNFFPDIFFPILLLIILWWWISYLPYAKKKSWGACVNHRKFKRVEYTLQRSCVHTVQRFPE